MNAPHPHIPTDGPDKGVPLCHYKCPHYEPHYYDRPDCKITGEMTDEGVPCHPAVREQSQMLAKAVEWCKAMPKSPIAREVLAILKPERSDEQ